MNRPQVVAGGVLVALGALFLLDAVDVLSAGAILSGWWPMVIVAIGVARLLSRPRDLLGGGITTGIGLLLLGLTLDLIEASILALVWPAVLITLGAWLLLSRGRTPQGATEEDEISAIAVFSGQELAPTSRQFASGSLFALFGGFEVDLRGCQPTAEGAHLDVTVVFGGCEITVPPGWRVRMHGPAVFAGTENGAAGQALPDDAPTIVVRSLALFGGVEVKVASLASYPG